MGRLKLLRRKLTKLRRRPDDFFRDSLSPAARAFGTLVPWSKLGLRESRPAKITPTRRAIHKTGLFDARFYVATYSDVRRSKDPLSHFLRHGIGEGRAPNAFFDPFYYARQAGIDPFDFPILHYARVGEAQGLKPHPHFDPLAYLANNPGLANLRTGLLGHYLRRGHRLGWSAQPSAAPTGREVPSLDDIAIAIIVPIYNGFAHAQACIESILLRTHLKGATLLLIDDASTDPRIEPLLDAYAALPRVTVLRNPTNLGFTKTVNRGLQHAAGSDVVLLNSDAVVTPRWLESLALAAYEAADIATATPLSDNAGAFSTPKQGANRTSELLALEDAARLAQRCATASIHDVPTGNGFCMYMRRAALDAVGLLDDVNFPRGYGEENDWCMRAGALGYRHVIALQAYVHHVNAASFGAKDKRQLVKHAVETVSRLHPTYPALLKEAFRDGTALTRSRAAMADTLTKKRRRLLTAHRPRALFVISTMIGGTPQTNEDLMHGLTQIFDPMLLVSDSKQIQLFDCSGSSRGEVARHELEQPVTFPEHTSAEYDTVISEWLVQHGIELVHVRHIAWHSLGLIAAAKRVGIPVVFSMHDFYMACPSVNLTNGVEPWSERGVVTPGICAPLWEVRDAAGLASIMQRDPHEVLQEWKAQMNAALSQCDAFITTCHTARQILQENLPVLKERDHDFHVIPHGRDFPCFVAPALRPDPNEPLRVLVPGNIGLSKGLRTIERLLELDTSHDLEFHLIGKAPSLLKSARVVAHGEYLRRDFTRVVADIQPHVGLILSIWPETFCHTLTECWAAGLPVVGSELGAVGERLRQSGAGWVVDPWDADGVIDLLLCIRDGREPWDPRAKALARWRESDALWDVESMTARYLDVYVDVDRKRRALLAGSAPPRRPFRRIALLVLGHFPHSMPTSHVRIATAVAQSRCERTLYEWVAPAELVRVGVDTFDGIVLCRNAAPPGVLRELLRQCRARNVPLVFDIDDDLSNVPPEKDPARAYPLFAPVMREAMRTATRTTVSTPVLAARFAKYARELRVAPNELDPHTWFGPVKPAPLPAELQDAIGPRILYMGSPTHREDLEILLPALESLRQQYGAHLCTIGVTRQSVESIFSISPPSARYDDFVAWFRTIAHHFDVAVAPLVDSSFNRAKSALKFMEYAAVGLPVVASDVTPYRDVIRHGQDGLLAANEPEAWMEAIGQLLTKPELRQRLVLQASARAQEEFQARACRFDELPWGSWTEQGHVFGADEGLPVMDPFPITHAVSAAPEVPAASTHRASRG